VPNNLATPANDLGVPHWLQAGATKRCRRAVAEKAQTANQGVPCSSLSRLTFFSTVNSSYKRRRFTPQALFSGHFLKQPSTLKSRKLEKSTTTLDPERPSEVGEEQVGVMATPAITPELIALLTSVLAAAQGQAPGAGAGAFSPPTSQATAVAPRPCCPWCSRPPASRSRGRRCQTRALQ
jgi:hypothetical protein